VIKISGNDKGVWVVGDARTNGSFSATVQLFTATPGIAGACAYASNYPPVGKYTSATEISFIGTPPYEIVLKDSGSGTITRESGSLFTAPTSYTVQSFSDKTGAPGIIDCTAPGSTVNFTAFSPCLSAATGTVWHLVDTREAAYNNSQTYTVKKMQDGRIWMVQDLKFGDKCNKTSFTGSTSNQTGSKLTSISGYIYGDCRNNTQANAGYLYDWAAAIQKSGAYYGGPDVGCSGTASGTSGTAPGACQGICPVGWHVPTGKATGEFYALHTVSGRNCSTSNDDCWDAASDWKGVLGGICLENGSLGAQSSAYYWSSTYYNATYASHHYYISSNTQPGTAYGGKHNGFTIRCIKNY
jgi:uncharacterized protein (TIGR02145 family)